MLAKEAKITDPKILDISYNDFKKQAPLNTEPTRVGAENILAQFPATGSTNIADYVDISILDQLKREGFFAELQKKYPTAR